MSGDGGFFCAKNAELSALFALIAHLVSGNKDESLQRLVERISAMLDGHETFTAEVSKTFDDLGL